MNEIWPSTNPVKVPEIQMLSQGNWRDIVSRGKWPGGSSFIHPLHSQEEWLKLLPATPWEAGTLTCQVSGSVREQGVVCGLFRVNTLVPIAVTV